MIALGKGLTLYICMCTVITGAMIMIDKIIDLFKPKEEVEKELKEWDEFIASNEELPVMLRRLFGDISGQEAMIILTAFVTYFPGLNAIVWFAYVRNFFGFKPKGTNK